MVDSDDEGVLEGWTKASVYIPPNKRTSIWFYGSYKEDGAVAIDNFNFVNCNSDPVPVTMAPITEKPGTTDGSDFIPTMFQEMALLLIPPVSGSTNGGDVFPIDALRKNQ